MARQRVRAVAAREREVLDAAAGVFHQHGYAAASIQHIADALGMRKGSLYHYIDAKEDLLFGILDAVHADVGVILADVRVLRDLTPLERLDEYVRRQVLFASPRRELMTIYFRDLDQLSPGRREALQRQRREHERFVRDVIARGQQAGEVVDGDPRLLANLVFGTMMWIHRWYRDGRGVEPAEVAEQCRAFVHRGVARRDR
jgi:AcrR family transcriptional regulator